MAQGMSDYTLGCKELWEEIVKVTSKSERDHHYSDLYVKVTPETQEIIHHYKYRRNVETFRDATDPHGALWYDIPFAYPYKE